MEATAKLMYLRITPRKVRIVANIIRGQKVGQALSALAYVEKRAAEPSARADDNDAIEQAHPRRT